MDGASGHLSLLIVTDAGTRTVPLPERGEVVVGRGREADVRVDDAQLSRRHVVIAPGNPPVLRDLGSLNGTTVGGRKLKANESLPLSLGDTITIGRSVLTLQSMATSARPRRVWSHGYFEARLEEECARADRKDAPFVIARVRLMGAGAAEDVTRILSACLRPSDIVAEYAPREHEILFVETDAGDAGHIARRIEEAFNRRGYGVHVGLATFKRDGRTPEALIAAASPQGHETGGLEAGTEPLRVGALQRLEPLIARIAPGIISVLIVGETGVGKEVLARIIHERSPRAGAKLVAINCAALPETLLESELFGHERGAFTGAVQARVGLLESAGGGTVFLDEIGEMPVALQAKLLRVLDQREVTRLGSAEARPIDVRFMAATNRDLAAEIQRGRFRQDFYFRLSGVTLAIPPLRERVEEIEPLARKFVAGGARQIERAHAPTISQAAVTLLERYEWPGNVRELKNVIERAVLLCTGDTIEPEHLPADKFVPVVAAKPTVPPAAEKTDDGDTFSDEEPSTQNIPILPATASTDDPERARIVRVLEECGWNQTQAARILGVARGTLIARMDQFELRRPRKR
jgi:DNA-binding NtrC family response regulator/GGDEF domain-containing protein